MGNVQTHKVVIEKDEPNDVQIFLGRRVNKWLLRFLIILFIVVAMAIKEGLYWLLDMMQIYSVVSAPIILAICLLIPRRIYRWLVPPGEVPHPLMSSLLILIGTILFGFYYHWWYWVIGAIIGSASVVPSTIKRLWWLQTLYRSAARGLIFVGGGFLIITAGEILWNGGITGLWGIRDNYFAGLTAIIYAYTQPINWWHIMTTISALVSSRLFLNTLVGNSLDRLSRWMRKNYLIGW